MNGALEKTITLILLIVLGLLLKSKFSNKDQTNGIKEIVLSVALPSTIFIALMKINIDSKMIFVPVLTIVFNFFMFFITPPLLSFFGVDKNSSVGRTVTMLVPSLAPGLSCFPFISEFLGEESLAMGALADVGNKFFVLIFLYLVAMNMFLRNTKSESSGVGEKIKSLIISLFKEPINLIMIAALVLLGFGYNYKSVPPIVADLFDKTSAMMTPLVLIFIGLAVQLKKGNKRMVFSILAFRAGITLLFSAIVIKLLHITDPTMVLIATVIPQSSASFWPFAHISAFNAKEDSLELPKEKRTFNLELAVLILAFSLPFSTLLILGILSAGKLFVNPTVTVASGFILILLGIVPNLLGRVFVRISDPMMKN
ncbi:hypothetical protein GVN16_10620 [Emticicia sp. CRIBPO]|jgi:predicted permease|uniref:hypothetical protein n=1 Tax=Emticicia sp. CRIBPO TaxID=2683258 RepID=UPI0014120A12|nr:hypothetical protein [Emticicia sp. CRIBPO]NBA86217.1 hypothetical protein [Emticicia sp. CRIBPO]